MGNSVIYQLKCDRWKKIRTLNAAIRTENTNKNKTKKKKKTERGQKAVVFPISHSGELGKYIFFVTGNKHLVRMLILWIVRIKNTHKNHRLKDVKDVDRWGTRYICVFGMEEVERNEKEISYTTYVMNGMNRNTKQ